MDCSGWANREKYGSDVLPRNITPSDIDVIFNPGTFMLDNAGYVLLAELSTQTEIAGADLILSWSDIEHRLGHDSWIISRKSSAVRVIGYLAAWEMGAELVATLDDDCRPASDYGLFEGHMDAMYGQSRWFNTTPGHRPRGLPYRNIGDLDSVVMNVGLWRNVGDWDAATSLACEADLTKYDPAARLRVWQWYEAIWQSVSHSFASQPLDTMVARAMAGYKIARTTMERDASRLDIPILSYDDLVQLPEADLREHLGQGWIADVVDLDGAVARILETRNPLGCQKPAPSEVMRQGRLTVS